MHKLWVTLSTLAVPKVGRDRDEGAGIVEYAAILILVAAVAVAVFNLGLVERISQAISSAVSSALSGPS